MLTDNISWEVERIVTSEYAKIEEELLRRIIADFWKGKDLSADNWRVLKLADLAKFQDTWKRTLAQLEKKAYREIEQEIEKAFTKSAGYDEWIVSKVAGLESASVRLSSFGIRLEQIIKKTRESMNLTGTKAIATAQQQFIDAVNSAYIQVQTGAMSLDEAMRKAVRDYADRGMTVQYVTDSGKVINYSLDASIRRDLISTLNQTASSYTMDMAKEYGTDLVRTSAHFGARPSHAVWQGKIFSISGNTKGYQKLSEATGYGTAGGLCGVNCRHTFFPYFAGYSREYDESEIPGIRENQEQYENQQKQRAYEREIRKMKRQISAASETGDRSTLASLKARYSSVRTEYLDFLDRKGLTRFSERER